MSVSDALQLILDFGSFVVILISLIVLLIKFFNQQNKK
ncbi:MAG: putative holin-like toxin [Lactobacillus helveticus]|nr:MAG: putative holin-like toxin [Lactobacillus helveticus]PXZ12846.1 putative holin-like toxin [Lactobacillus helveticus]PXZ13981.1 putative holin-like toxin [Lactobacillus helveticus]PXZ17368.1 putative holin-like toxin [Lactobacillus helveticus]PXZ22133.1 putative holin-like toxin [Lactobacillus helveticus]